MIELFPDPEKEKRRHEEIARIRSSIQNALGEKSEKYQIKINELDHCPDPACEKIETLILLLGEPNLRFQFRFTCSLVDLTEDKMKDFFKDLEEVP